jgi:hypothetical protein
MRPFAIAAMMIALLPASAFAQQQQGPLTSRSDADKKTDAEIDEGYRKALKRTVITPAAPRDPWGAVRPAGTSPDKPGSASR